jgi:hypothetical protein
MRPGQAFHFTLTDGRDLPFQVGLFIRPGWEEGDGKQILLGFGFAGPETPLVTRMGNDPDTGDPVYDVHMALRTDIGAPGSAQPGFGVTDPTGAPPIFMNLGSQISKPGNTEPDRPDCSATITQNLVFSGGEGTMEVQLDLFNTDIDSTFWGPPLVLAYGFLGLMTVEDISNGSSGSSSTVAAKFENPEDQGAVINQSHGGTSHSYLLSTTAFRRNSSESTRDFRVSFTIANGRQISIPLTASLSGDSKADSSPPELLDSRWMTKREKSNYLDLYPLWGRSANAKILLNWT